ncbi:hypothetical protein Ancab_019110 [Ancistrocladus abbreviatus]
MCRVMKFEDFKELGNESAVKAAGKYRQEGKTYVVQMVIKSSSSSMSREAERNEFNMSYRLVRSLLTCYPLGSREKRGKRESFVYLFLIFFYNDFSSCHSWMPRFSSVELGNFLGCRLCYPK